MAKNKIPPEFIVRIAVKNEHGNITGEREYVLYSGLLAVAHELGLAEIDTAVIKLPTEADPTAVVRALVKGRVGVFAGLGDATPNNCNKKVAKHLLRVAETRAKARALRDFTNIALVALEELGDDADVDLDPTPPAARANVVPLPSREERRDRRPAMATDAQKRALFRKALGFGFENEIAVAFLARRLGVPVERATKEQASKLLDELSAEERVAAANGGDHAA